MKRLLVLLLVLMMISTIALAETAADLVPDTTLWGISRTRLKEANDAVFTDVEIGEYKSLMIPGLEVDSYTMDAYFEFSSKEKNYNGLSRVVYLLDVQKKVTDANLTKCFNALVKDMKTVAKQPSTSTKTNAIWYFQDCTLEINIGKYTEYNKSKNKTVAVVFSAPETAEENNAKASTTPKDSKASSGKNNAKKMSVSATATCNNYNQVGNEWEQECYINGKKVKETSEITLAAGDTVTVKAKITEKDASPDIGIGEESYTVTKSDLTNGFTISFTVKVAEDKGINKDKTARWNVKFKFQP